nr:hypothetical protein [Streptomyces longispororuber]
MRPGLVLGLVQADGARGREGLGLRHRSLDGLGGGLVRTRREARLEARLRLTRLRLDSRGLLPRRNLLRGRAPRERGLGVLRLRGLRRRGSGLRGHAGRPGRRGGRRLLSGTGLRGLLRLAPRALGTRHQQQVVVLGGVLGGIEEGVGVRRGDARLLHHACALRQPLARDLAGVGHAYPSPIG